LSFAIKNPESLLVYGNITKSRRRVNVRLLRKAGSYPVRLLHPVTLQAPPTRFRAAVFRGTHVERAKLSDPDPVHYEDDPAGQGFSVGRTGLAVLAKPPVNYNRP